MLLQEVDAFRFSDCANAFVDGHSVLFHLLTRHEREKNRIVRRRHMPAKFVTCQLCGHGFGSASIAIHIPQCYDKALKRWQLDPRGPKPVMPHRGGVGGTVHQPLSKDNSIASLYGDGRSTAPASLRAPLSQQQQQLFAQPEAFPSGNPNLHPCRKCKRTFAFDRIAYHESVCKGNKKRKEFNSKKQRLSDFDEFEIRAAAGGSKQRQVPVGISRGASRAVALIDSRPGGATSWRQQHADFINAIRSARRYQAQHPVAPSHNLQQQRGSNAQRAPRQPFASNALRNPETFRGNNRSNALQRQQHAVGAGVQPSFPANGSVVSSRTPAGSGRGAVNAARNPSTNFGGPPNSGSWGGAAPSYRIEHTNHTSQAMLQAFGRY